MSSAISQIFGGDESPAPAPAPAPAPEPAKPAPAEPTNADINARAKDFETRGQVLDQRASAAGATRSDNDADVLGYVLPRKRSAGRAILG